MRPFVPHFQGTPWPDGLSVLHVYLLPDLATNPELAQLVTACRQAMRPYPILMQNDQQLHITLEMVADTSSAAIGPAERENLTEALRKHLASVPPLRVMAGSPIANKAGAVLDLSPDEPLMDLTDRVREAITETRGPEAIQHPNGRPHMSLGYSWDVSDSDPLQSALRSISPSHAPVTVTDVHLLDVRWSLHPHEGTRAWDISWDHLASVPLRGE